MAEEEDTMSNDDSSEDGTADNDETRLDMTGDGSPRAVGHNIYILAHQLAKHNRDLAQALRPDQSLGGTEALQYYKKHTAQIEVRTRVN